MDLFYRNIVLDEREREREGDRGRERESCHGGRADETKSADWKSMLKNALDCAPFTTVQHDHERILPDNSFHSAFSRQRSSGGDVIVVATSPGRGGISPLIMVDCLQVAAVAIVIFVVAVATEILFACCRLFTRIRRWVSVGRSPILLFTPSHAPHHPITHASPFTSSLHQPMRSVIQSLHHLVTLSANYLLQWLPVANFMVTQINYYVNVDNVIILVLLYVIYNLSCYET